MSTFYEEIKDTLDIFNKNQPSCFDMKIRNLIKSAALSGKTKEEFNLRERKNITQEELSYLAVLISEGFSVNINLDLATQTYPSLSIEIGWE